MKALNLHKTCSNREPIGGRDCKISSLQNTANSRETSIKLKKHVKSIEIWENVACKKAKCIANWKEKTIKWKKTLKTDKNMWQNERNQPKNKEKTWNAKQTKPHTSPKKDPKINVAPMFWVPSSFFFFGGCMFTTWAKFGKKTDYSIQSPFFSDEIFLSRKSAGWPKDALRFRRWVLKICASMGNSEWDLMVPQPGPVTCRVWTC